MVAILRYLTFAVLLIGMLSVFLFPPLVILWGRHKRRLRTAAILDAVIANRTVSLHKRCFDSGCCLLQYSNGDKSSYDRAFKDAINNVKS
jgi:hypothetical protein